MGSSNQARALWVAVCLLAVSTAPSAAEASEELTNAEMRSLSAGELVIREDEAERGGRRYIGGVSYIVIDAPPVQVATLLHDARVYREILPRTRSVRWLGLSRSGEAVLELEQGTSLVHARYTVRVRRDEGGGDGAVIRFWLDPRFSHDISDASGFFRVEPFREKTLLTYMVMVDLGNGLIVRLFENSVRSAALSTPALVKAYVESHRPPS